MGGGCICKIHFLHEDPDCVIYNSVSTEMMILKEKWEKWSRPISLKKFLIRRESNGFTLPHPEGENHQRKVTGTAEGLKKRKLRTEMSLK